MKLRAFIVLTLVLVLSVPSYAEVLIISRPARAWLLRIFDEIDRAEELKDVPAETVGELEYFVQRYPRTDVTDKALFTLARTYSALGYYSKARPAYGKLLDEFAGSRLREGAEAQLQEIEGLTDTAALIVGINPEDAVIGVVLPLKGKYSRFGQGALKGIRLAAGVFKERYWPVKLLVADVGSSEELFKKLTELSENPNVLGLIGPLASRSAVPLGRFAQSRSMPIIVLSQKSGVPGLGDYVFRNFLTPRQQAASVAVYAYSRLGLRSFAILYPESGYGRRLAGLFTEEVKRLGGEVVSVGSYAEGEVDFAGELESLFLIDTYEHMKGRRRITEFKRRVNADALYLPGFHSTVGLIAPYLPYYDIMDVTLIGSSGWNSPGLVELAGDYLEGSVFVDGFYAKSVRAGTAEFVRRFEQVYGYEPGIIEATAYDSAMMLMLSLSPAKGPLRRDIVRDRLKTIGFDGASGSIRFDATGEAQRRLFLLTVKDGAIVEIE